ncbi:MAG: prolyl oligopeptidase family serine peptidase [Thermoproteota archaeon]
MVQIPQVFEKEVVKKISIKYLLYLPEDYAKKPKVKWPTILFLHGIGERGDNLELVKKLGIPKILEEKPNFPFIVISPQCPSNSMWPMMVEELRYLLLDALKRYRIDEMRVYLTGLSMGGFGTWHLASTYPDLFAAIVPICGGMFPDEKFQERIRALKNIPIWIFHGAKDEIVPVENSKRLYDAIKKIGGKVRLTIYPDLGHDSWTVTYNNPRLYKWLLKQRKRQPRKTR